MFAGTRPLCRVIPIDRAATDQAGELAGAIAELVADGGEGQHQMQVVPHAVDEVLVQELRRVHEVRPGLFDGVVAQVLEDHLQLVFGVQPGDLPGGQDHVDVLQVGLVLHLVVREQEHYGGAGSRQLVQRLQVFHQVVQTAPSKEAGARVGWWTSWRWTTRDYRGDLHGGHSVSRKIRI